MRLKGERERARAKESRPEHKLWRTYRFVLIMSVGDTRCYYSDNLIPLHI